MKCKICNKRFADGAAVVPVLRYVINEKRGDFVGRYADEFIHLSCWATP